MSAFRLGPNGAELYKTDGNRVTEVADINPGVVDSAPRFLTPFSDELFFAATGPEGRGLYRTDGNSVTEVANLNPFELTPFAGELFFGANSSNGVALYATDGNAVAYVENVNPSELTPFGDELFFSADGPDGRELYATDGTTVTQVADINPGTGDSEPSGLTQFGDELFFFATGPNGRELYATDGTTVAEVADINPGAADSDPSELTLLGDTLFFSADGTDGRELYRLAPIQQLFAGDANQDLVFDQMDLVHVLQSGKYLTGEVATWGEGDWDGAPGGHPGNPPSGDGVFNQIDIMVALSAGKYLTGPYGAMTSGYPKEVEGMSTAHDASSGELAEGAPPERERTPIDIASIERVSMGESALNLEGDLDNDADDNIFKATFGSPFGSITFGNVARTGLAEDSLLNDLTGVAGGGDLGAVNLIYVPEPSSILLLGVGVLAIVVCRRAQAERRGRVVE